MITQIHPKFDKAFAKRIQNNPVLYKKTLERIAIFRNDPGNPILKDHQLKGVKKYLRSFSITGDVRIIYFPIDTNTVVFIDIGTHNQVY